KLVQIIGKYTDKPDTQMQRHLPVHRFLQDTLIKGKPGNVSRIELIRHSINFFCFKNSKILVVTLLNKHKLTFRKEFSVTVIQKSRRAFSVRDIINKFTFFKIKI